MVPLLARVLKIMDCEEVNILSLYPEVITTWGYEGVNNTHVGVTDS
jgi:hypothetical protein